MAATRKKTKVLSEEVFSLTPRAALLALRAAVERTERAPRHGGPLAIAEAATAVALGPETILLLPADSCNRRAFRAHLAPRRAADAIAMACAELVRQPGRLIILSLPKRDRAGEWRAAINFAVDHKLPILFLTPTRYPKAAGDEDLRLLQAELGVYVIGVDGEDAIAIYRAATEAAHHARIGRGPTLIEAIRVRGPQRVDAMAALKAYMTRQGCWEE